MESITLDKGMPTNTSQAKKRQHAKLGFSKFESRELVDALNALLASYSVHYQKLRNFHWNVKGPDFFDVHEKFEEQYNQAKVAIDDVAERIRVFGQTPYSTMREYLEHSKIKESATDLGSHQMVHEIIKDYEILLEEMYHVIDVALQTGDSGTEDLAKSFIKKIEKNHWMMSAFNYSES